MPLKLANNMETVEPMRMTWYSAMEAVGARFNRFTRAPASTGCNSALSAAPRPIVLCNRWRHRLKRTVSNHALLRRMSSSLWRSPR